MPSHHHTLGDALEGAVGARLEALTGQQLVRRLWAKDPSLWSPDPAQQALIRSRLGWLTVLDPMRRQAPELARFADAAAEEGFRHALLLGMGGASLFPEVLARCIPPHRGALALQVLDTTDPGEIRAAEAGLDLDKTLVVVSSKSGSTLETLSLYRHFAARIPDRRFLAVTDPGTPLEHLAREKGFRRIFRNPTDVGGRYAALTYVGLLPAALMGLDLYQILDHGRGMAAACGAQVPGIRNPAVRLGAILAEAALAGRDKLTLLLPSFAPGFGAWLEQLLAESLGKNGLGIVPVEGEPAGRPGTYGADRLFACFGDVRPPSGQPFVQLPLRDPYDIMSECLRWEIATAVAASVLGVNPFDEPDVQESKDLTRRLLVEGPGIPGPQGQEGGGLEGFLDEARPGDYLALLAYLPRRPELESALQRLRGTLRDRSGLAVTLGYGPRYLHSTGQLHKGGPDRGLFLLLTYDAEDLPIPGEPYGFGALQRAQALGDLQALRRRGRRVRHVHLGADPASLAGLEASLAAS